MKLDKTQIAELLKKSDDALWADIRGMASSRGFNLPERTPAKEDMQRIRAALGNIDGISPATALRLMSEIKRRGKNG